MSYLLDTCVLSEFTRKAPSKKVVSWLDRQPEPAFFLSTVVVGEVARGVAKLPDSAKKRKLDAWLHTDLLERFRGRVLSVDIPVALEWGRLSNTSTQQGLQLGMADGLIAATALHHGLVLVTRNVGDFQVTGVSLFNPWTDA